jgi:hypothetical protein
MSNPAPVEEGGSKEQGKRVVSISVLTLNSLAVISNQNSGQMKNTVELLDKRIFKIDEH